MIDVLDELLPVDNPAGPDFVTRVLVFRHQHRAHPAGAWAYVAWTKGTLTLWRFGVGAADLLPAQLETSAIAADNVGLAGNRRQAPGNAAVQNAIRAAAPLDASSFATHVRA